jgi:hypothetical protein
MSSRRDFILNASAGLASFSSASRLLAQSPTLLPQDGSIHEIRVGSPIVLPDNFGDTWVTAWADDDNLYTPADDALGFGIPAFLNKQAIKLFQSDYAEFEKQLTLGQKKDFDKLMGPINFNCVEGGDPRKLRGRTVNRVESFVALDRGSTKPDGTLTGPPDGRSWKSSGCSFIDGALYWVVARHKYPEKENVVGLRQEAANASIVRSTDYGKSWVRSAKENLDAPMFPGPHFATPYFVDYGRSGLPVHGADRYVYAISNNGFWDNGDTLILGRVPRARLDSLSGADWQFFTGGDGLLDANWTSDAAAARPIMEKPGKFGMTGAVYLPARRRYMMIGWYYPGGSGYFKDALGASSITTVWDFYEAPTPWGPWTYIHSHRWSPQGYYTPGICPKFQTANRVYVTTAGDFRNWWDHYHLTFVPIDLS